jgi:hypothetical protein
VELVDTGAKFWAKLMCLFSDPYQASLVTKIIEEEWTKVFDFRVSSRHQTHSQTILPTFPAHDALQKKSKK